MSAPNDVNVSHSIGNFVARRQTNRKSLGRGGSYSGSWSQGAAELAGRAGSP